MITDLMVMITFVETSHAAWATIMMICIINPLLVIYAPLITYLMQGNSFDSPVGEVFGWIFVTFFSLVMILALDMLSAFFTVITFICSPFFKVPADDMLEYLFMKIFNFSVMDIKGIRKLRSVS